MNDQEQNNSGSIHNIVSIPFNDFLFYSLKISFTFDHYLETFLFKISKSYIYFHAVSSTESPKLGLKGEGICLSLRTYFLFFFENCKIPASYRCYTKSTPSFRHISKRKNLSATIYKNSIYPWKLRPLKSWKDYQANQF